MRPLLKGEFGRREAVTCFWLNLLVFPGLGTFMAGKRRGLLEMAAALTGFVLFTVWLVSWLKMAIDAQGWPTGAGPYERWAYWGGALMVGIWLESFCSGWMIIKQTPVA